MSLAHWLRSLLEPTPAHKRPPIHWLAGECLEARDNPSGGLLDPTFGSGGTGFVTTATSDGGDQAYAVLVQTDGKIVAAGYGAAGSGTQFTAVRYTTDGALDPSFGTGGKVGTKVTSYSAAWAAALQPDGKIILGGFASKTWNSDRDFALVRYNADGTLDSSFGKRGQVITDFAGATDSIHALTVQPDGKIVAAGMSRVRGTSLNGYSLGLARYNPNGALDATFGAGGKVVVHLAGTWDQEVNSIAIQSDGRIVVAATAMNGPSLDPDPTKYTREEFLVARFTPSGQLDTAPATGFGTVDPTTGQRLGYVLQDLGERANDRATALVIQPADGKIVVAGQGAGHSFVAVRFNPDGTRDTSFGPSKDGIAVADPGAVTDGRANGVALQPDGKIVLAGSVAGKFALARFNSDGTADAGFGAGGAQLSPVGGGANAVAVQPDGRIVTAGTARVGSTDDFAVARFLGDAPQIGSFTASSYAPPSGGFVTLTASGITDENPNATISQVDFYYFNDTGTKQLLGTGTQPSQGVWELTFVVGLPPGTYPVYAQATDSYGAVGDPITLSLQVA